MNSNNESLYKKKIDCPVCGNNFNQTNIKKNKSRIVKKDSDFCIHFENENPYFYDILVCPDCGYSASEKEFKMITRAESKNLKALILYKWKRQDYTNSRTIEDAIKTHKLAILQGNLINKNKTYIGLLTLKLAWFYRYLNNKDEEVKFIKLALENLEKAYYKDDFTSTSFSINHCAYLVGELYRKLHNYDEAIKWFDIALKVDRQISQHFKNQIRFQWQEAAEEKRATSKSA